MNNVKIIGICCLVVGLVIGAGLTLLYDYQTTADYYREALDAERTQANVLTCVDVELAHGMLLYREYDSGVWDTMQLEALPGHGWCAVTFQEEWPFNNFLVFRGDVPDGTTLWVTSRSEPVGSLMRVRFQNQETPPIYAEPPLRNTVYAEQLGYTGKPKVR